MDTKDKRITRILKRKNGNQIEADEMLKDKYDRVFGNDYLERVEVIDIQTTYNDYKKLHDDLYELSKGWGKKIVCFSSSTDILDIVKMKEVRKACRKKRISEERPLLILSKICTIFLPLLNIAQIICSFIFPENYLLPTKIVLPILIVCLLIALIFTDRLTKDFDRKLLDKLDNLSEDVLIDIYSNLKHKKSLLTNEGIFFIENFSKLHKNCRSYLIAYLRHKEYKKQIWCFFDYLFEDSLKIDSVEESVFYESFKLVPLKYEEKEIFYKEYNLQREIAKEYLNCIGVDILWGSKINIANDSFKFHSLDYIQERFDKIRKEFDFDGRLTRIFYCLVYMSSKYRYSFSINQMISLIQNEEKVNPYLRNIICDASNKVLDGGIKSHEEIRVFISKITNLLEGYYFTEYKREGGLKMKRYKFSYDILEYFHERMSIAYPDEEIVKKWILVKLISNQDIFQMDRYFFDCSNLLVTSDYLEDNEFCILSSYLLRIMNANNCWVYNSSILMKLYSIKEDIRKQYLPAEVIKKAATNYLFYVSDNDSMHYGIYFLAGTEGCQIVLDDFSLDSCMGWMPEMEKYSNVLAAYFELLYKTFGSVISAFFKFGQPYQDIDIEPLGEQELLPEIIRKLLMCCISSLNEDLLRKTFDESSDWITKQLPKLKSCPEANEFASIVEEILLWVKSQLDSNPDRIYRNTYIGMLIETSNSNMLYFIYGLLNMALVKDKEMIYKNKNTLLDFISLSIFYFKVIAQADGIATYVNTLLQSQQSTNLKLNIAINLLIRPIPCRDILRNFILAHMDSSEILFLSRLEHQSLEQMEEYIASLLLYNANIENSEFTKKIFGQVFNYISESAFVDGNKINKYLQLILDKKCPEEEIVDIVDEINQIRSAAFAVWVLYGYCAVKKEMLERVPQISPHILTKCGSNLGQILIAKYLLNHSYYDCNQYILELFLNIMRYEAYPNEHIIIDYLNIIDKYANDNQSIKYNEMATYNRLLSLYLFYSVVKLSELKESDGILLRETMKFILNILRGLQTAGIKIIASNGIFSSLVKKNNTLTRSQEADKLIIEKFLHMSPIICIKGKNCLSDDYYHMILYMLSFPDVCTPLIQRANKNCMEIINQKHLLYLMNILLEYAQTNTLGFDRNSLFRIKNILEERYNIKY